MEIIGFRNFASSAVTNRPRLFHLLAVLGVYAGAMILSCTAYAQIKSGVITGTVTDPSGAVVPHAKVEVVSVQTNVINTTTSNSSGEYTVPYLEVGTYTVKVTAPGFESFVIDGVNLSTASTVREDAHLQLGSTAATVNVSANAVQLQTESTSDQTTIPEAVIAAVPNINQNPLYYATLAAGVIPRMEMDESQNPQSFGIGFSGRRFDSAFDVNGGSAFTNDIELDGLTVMGSAWNEATVLPNTDSLREVHVVTNDFSAEYGRGQGVVDMVTKSGTNHFHGDLYYRIRNEAFNANTYSNNANNIARPAFRENDFGGAFGGPILHNKLFFFTSYELMTHSDTALWLLTVPTAAQRGGDFSQTLIADNNGQPTPATIYNPYDVTQLGTNLYQRGIYSNATLPSPDPRALAIMNIYPLPNHTPINFQGNQNFFTSKRRTFLRSNMNNRLDFQHGEQSFYVSGGVEVGNITTPSPYGANSPYYVPPTATDSQGGSSLPEYVSDDNPYLQLGVCRK